MSSADRKRVAVRCSGCGEVWLMLVANMRNWQGRCRSCAGKGPNRRGADHPNWRGGLRKVVKTACIDCGIILVQRAEKRRRPFKGRCRSCAAKEVASRPEIRKLHSDIGHGVMSSFGGRLPPPKPENRPRGANHPFWRGGVTLNNQNDRWSPRAEQWRKTIFERDKYKCTICGNGGDLHADHIKPFSLFKEQRFDIDNGRTLCIPCHSEYGAIVSGHGVLVREAVIPHVCGGGG